MWAGSSYAATGTPASGPVDAQVDRYRLGIVRHAPLVAPLE